MSERSGFNSWRGLVVTVAAVAGVMAAVNVARGWVSGPTTNLGSNPLKSYIIEFTAKGETTNTQGSVIAPPVQPQPVKVLEVPAGQSFRLLYVEANATPQTNSCWCGASITWNDLVVSSGAFKLLGNQPELSLQLPLPLEEGVIIGSGEQIFLKPGCTCPQNTTCTGAAVVTGEFIRN